MLSKVGSVAHAGGLWVWNCELLLVVTTRIAPCWMGLGSLKWGGAAVPVERVEYTMWPVDGACGLGQIAGGVAFGDDAIMDESGTWECLVTACCRPGCRHSESLRFVDFASWFSNPIENNVLFQVNVCLHDVGAQHREWGQKMTHKLIASSSPHMTRNVARHRITCKSPQREMHASREGWQS